MPEYTLYQGLTHYSVNDVYDSDCYFICEFYTSDYDHKDGFSNDHLKSLPTIESEYPNCVGCLQVMIRELESELDKFFCNLN